MALNEALIVDGKVITTNPKKADAFTKLYTSVSKLTFTKEAKRLHATIDGSRWRMIAG
jgi:hypothetical protein